MVVSLKIILLRFATVLVRAARRETLCSHDNRFVYCAAASSGATYDATLLVENFGAKVLFTDDVANFEY